MPPTSERCLFDEYPPPTSWIISVVEDVPEPVLYPFLQAWPCSASARGTRNLPVSFRNLRSVHQSSLEDLKLIAGLLLNSV